MKPLPLRWIAVTAAAVAAVLCWYLLTMEPDATPRTVGKGMAPAALVTGKGFASSAAEALPKSGTDEFNRALHERGLKWLNSRGRDAAGLVAIWDLTGDQALLREAAERFPHDPRVCLAVIQHAGEWNALPWVERLIAAEPTNPEGHYQKAKALWEGDLIVINNGVTNAKDRAGALAALREAAAMSSPRNNHQAERIGTAREAALACGVGPRDTVRLALTQPSFYGAAQTYGTLNSAINILSYELADVMASGNEERLSGIVGIGLSTVEKFSSGPCITITNEMNAQQLKLAMLARLPDDTPIGEGGRSVGALKEEVIARLSHLTASLQMAEERAARVVAADDIYIGAYFKGYMTGGELEAENSLMMFQKLVESMRDHARSVKSQGK